MVMVCYDAAFEPEVMEALESAGITHWSGFKRLVGKGSGTPRMDDATWPGFNNAIFALCEADAAARLGELLAEFKRQGKLKGAHAFCWEASILT